MTEVSDAATSKSVRLWRTEAAPYREKLGRYLFQILNRLQSSTLCTSKLRRSLLRVVGMDIGQHCWVARRVHFSANRVKLGCDVGINMYSYLDAAAFIEIGDHTRLGPYVKILTGTHPLERSVIRRKGDLLIGKSVTIERGCWLHIGCTVLPGVRIREGCVIAAGAVVTKDTDPNGWYAGIPATRVKDLPTEEVEILTNAVVTEIRDTLTA